MRQKERMQPMPKLFLIDYALSIASFCASGGTVIVKFMEYYGFSLAVSNFVLAMPSTLLVMQIWGGFCYGKSEKKHRFLKRWGIVWRTLLPLVFFTACLPRTIGGISMLLLYIGMVAAHQFVAPAQSSWLVDETENKISSNYFSLREVLFVACYVGFTLLFGLFMESGAARRTLSGSFMLIGVFAALFLLIDGCVFLRLPKPDEKSRVIFSAPTLLEPFRTKGFRDVIWINAVWNISVMFIGNFAGVYQVQVLKLDTMYLIGWGTVCNILKLVLLVQFARIAECIGWKSLTKWCVWSTGMVGIGWMLIRPANAALFFPLLAFLGMLPSCGQPIGFFRLQIAHCPSEQRSFFFAVNATVGGMSSALGAGLCSMTMQALQNLVAQPPYFVLFAIGACGCFYTGYLIRKIPSAANL